MSTDITYTYEIRKNGVWEAVELMPVPAEPEDEDQWDWSHPSVISQSYALFSVMAGVRNTFSIFVQ